MKETQELKTSRKRTERGITLLALILTVVIMIILAAVTINVTLGEGGLVWQAQHAAEQTVNATKSEQEQLDDVASQINDIIAGIGSGGSGGDMTNSTGGEDTNQVGETNTVDTNSVDTNSVDTNSVEETNTVDTNTIEPEPEPLPDGTITIGDPQWQEDGTANITVSTTEEDVTIEYQIGGTDEEKWTEVEGGTITGIENGETVYVRITDGDQASNPQEKKVEDTTAPESANIEINPANVLVGESLTATITHVDRGIGVDVENSKWVLTESADAIGTGADVLSQYTEKFTANPETITLNSNTAGTYYLHVLTVDKAGNKTETVSSAITISSITGTVSKSGDVSWNAGQATLVLQSSEEAGSQLKIVYKINGEGKWQDYNGTSITGLSHGDKVTACLTNASQTTFGPETEFEIQDTVDPTVTVTAQGSPTTNSITVTAQAVDNESGMKASPTYTFQIKQSGSGDYTTPSGASNISNATYTFTGLTQSTTYDIQVVVNGDNAGNTGTGTLLNQTTTTVPGASEGLVTGSITASPATWSGGKASTTLTTTTNFKIQYQVNGTSEEGWSAATDSPVTVSNLDHGNTVYARLTDGTNAGNYAAINILDGTPPTVSVEVGEVTETTIEVTVDATDNESGLADSNAYRYYLNDEEAPRATSSSNTYTYEGLTGSTEYTIKVEVVDKAGTPGTGTTQATTEVPSIPETTTQVANYADVDGNGSVDGVIYADLAVGGSGSGLGQSYTIPTSSNFKKYRVTQESYSGSFGTGQVIAPITGSSGNERFYVMALSNVTGSYSTWYWYNSAWDYGMSDYASQTSTAFGRGEQNTINMISKWNSNGYGSQNARDIWGASAVNSRTWNGSSGWYVPSLDEWAAFAGELNITRSNYSSKGLSDGYWSSSQRNTYGAWRADFDRGNFSDYYLVYNNTYVRLGTTF